MNWTRPSRCTSGGCVEVAVEGDTVRLRDRSGATVAYDRQEWVVFAAAVKAGEFDLELR